MKFWKIVLICVCSLLIGFINGLLGGGGGMICVPFLVYLLSFKEKNAHATAIFIMLATSIVSSIFYIVQGHFPLSTGLYVGSGAIVGGILGAILLKKISNKVINVLFYVIMLVAGIKLLI